MSILPGPSRIHRSTPHLCWLIWFQHAFKKLQNLHGSGVHFATQIPILPIRYCGWLRNPPSKGCKRNPMNSGMFTVSHRLAIVHHLDRSIWIHCSGTCSQSIRDIWPWPRGYDTDRIRIQYGYDVYMYIYIYTDIHIYVYLCMYINICIYIYVCI